MTDMRATVDLPRMSARLSYPHSNQRDPDRYATIRVEDEDSGQEICKIELNPDQLFLLMAGNLAYGEGRATAQSHRLGRRMERETTRLDRAEWGLAYDSDETHPAIQAHLTVARQKGWEVAQYQRKRGEHYIVTTRWVEIEEGTGEVEPAGTGGGAPGA